MRALLLLGTAVLMGCASEPWNRPGATAQDFYHDRYRCEQEARGPSTTIAVPLGSAVYVQQNATVDERLWASCMRARGWRQDSEPAGRVAPALSSPSKGRNCVRKTEWVTSCD
jgi:hypothetical protein